MAVAVVIGMLFASTFYLHHRLQSHPKENNSIHSLHTIITPEENLIIGLWPHDQADQKFFVSLTSCVEDCSTIENEKPKKVGLLVPPGTMSLQIFIQFCKTFLGEVSSSSLQLIPTSHLPPSTNEYTHIIRFANVPLLLAAGDALLNVASPREPISYTYVTESIQLLYSWHCQLSNLAEEGLLPLLTISMEELDEDQEEVEMRFIEFLDLQENDYNDMDEEEESDILIKSIDAIKGQFLTLNKMALKEKKKGLISLAKEAIRDADDYVKNEKDKELWKPSSPLAQRLYHFLKEGTPQDDLALCNQQKICLQESFLDSVETI